MAKQDNIAAQESLADNLNSGDIAAAVESFAEDCVDHDPMPGQEAGHPARCLRWSGRVLD